MGYRPLKVFLLSLGLTVLVGLPRILPAQELIHSQGGIQQMLAAHPKTYQPDRIEAYPPDELWQEVTASRLGLVTVGWVPVALSGIALLASWRTTLAWGISVVLFGWLAMAHHAGIDLLKLLWNLPVFESIYQPHKYFTFQIVFGLAILSGRCVCWLRQLRFRWLEGLVALALIASSVGVLYPPNKRLQQGTYTIDAPSGALPSEEGFFQVEGRPSDRVRDDPPRALSYYNLRRSIGTIDWYTGVPIPGYAVPKYFVTPDNVYMANPEYRGEAYLLESVAGTLTAAPVFTPNLIAVAVDMKAPGTLVINQNFHPDWYADLGTLRDRDGLLAVSLEQAGTYTIHLHYYPRSFFGGLTVTIVGLLALAWISRAHQTDRLRRLRARFGY
jgi:hypothetical protein